VITRQREGEATRPSNKGMKQTSAGPRVARAPGAGPPRRAQLIPSVGPTMRRIVKTTSMLTAAIVIGLIAASPVAAKVAPATLADVVQRADFIGIVRVDSVSTRIPLLKRRHASATILQSWKGQPNGKVRFIAEATWTCDISEAKVGEEAIVFIEGDRLVLAGRGRMPANILVSDDGRCRKRLAEISTRCTAMSYSEFRTWLARMPETTGVPQRTSGPTRS